MVRPPHVLAAVALASWPAAAAAGAFDLGEVVVTARREAIESIGTVRVIDGDTAAARGARTLDDALERLPGVNVRVGGDGTPRVDVRGLRTRQVKLLVNGVPFNAAADGQFDPTLIPVDAIGRVKLTTGASSLLYGDGALAGVLNVVTRQGRPGTRTRLRLEGAEGPRHRLTGSWSAGNDTTSVFVSVARDARDGWPLSGDFSPTAEEDGGIRENSDRRRDSLFATLTWGPDETWDFGLAVNWTAGRHGIPGSTIDDEADVYANPPRHDRVEAERGWYAQLNAAWDPAGPLRNDAWVYTSNSVEALHRYADASFSRIAPVDALNVFENESRTRVYGAHDHLTWTLSRGGELTIMVEARQERLSEDCLVQDVPLPTPAATAPAASATSYVVEFTDLLTNDHGPTTPAGTHAPVARLVATDRPGGGIDFTLDVLAIDQFGPGAYLQSVFLAPASGIDVSAWAWAQGLGSEGEVGNALIGTNGEDAEGYDYPIRVNFRRPGQGDPLLQGETGLWSFFAGQVDDLFATPTARTGSPGADMFAAVRIRGADGAGFWGLTPIDLTGGGPVPRVFAGAPAALAAGGPVTPPIVVDPDTGTPAVLARACGGGGGGGGNGTGGGQNRVEIIPGRRFAQRLVSEERAIEVVNTAIEYSVRPWPALGLVLGAGQHVFVGDDGATTGEVAWNAGLSWDVTATTRLRTALSRKVRIPSIAQLYNPQGGNPDLDFETALGWEGGVTQRLPRAATLDVTLFAQDVDNFIQRDALTGFFSNVEQSAFRGVEAALALRPWSRLDLDFSYTRLHHRDESPGTDRKQIQYTPEHKAVAQADLRVTAAVDAHLAVTYLAGQYYYSRGAPRLRDRLDDYALVDARVAWRAPGERLSLYLGADNLLDRDYAESYGLPQAGRLLYGGVELTFD